MEGMASDVVETCRFCGGESQSEFDAREMMKGLRHEFTYARCRVCNSLWLKDVPADLSPYYGPGYYSMAADPKGSQPSTAAAIWARVLLAAEPLSTRLAGRRGFPRYLAWFAGLGLNLNTRIADVGSGEASFLTQMSRHGFRHLWGFDPFIADDRDAHNAHYRKGSLSRACGTFDLIVFNHSLEHVPNPAAELGLARDHLAPRGAIVVRVPVANSYADRLYGADWFGLDPPRHLGVPSAAGMAILANSLGLSIERTFYDSTAAQFWASERYQADLALSELPTPSAAETEKMRSHAADLNRHEDGDTAGFVLRCR